MTPETRPEATQSHEQWVKLSEWKTDAPIIQSITAVTIWPTLTEKQKRLVASCRIEVDPKAKYPDRFKVDVDAIKDAPAATLRSLEAKGVVDEFGRLTIPGIYTALWNGLEADADARARREANRLAAVVAGQPTEQPEQK